MATKPTERILDGWADGGTATDPGAGKESSGWAPSERMPAGWLNYLFSSLFKWVGFLAAGAVRARGTAVTDGVGGVTLDADHQGCSASIVGDSIRITFDETFASANFQVVAMYVGDAQDKYCVSQNKTTARVDINVIDSSTSTQQDSSNNVQVVDFIVMGGN